MTEKRRRQGLGEAARDARSDEHYAIWGDRGYGMRDTDRLGRALLSSASYRNTRAREYVYKEPIMDLGDQSTLRGRIHFLLMDHWEGKVKAMERQTTIAAALLRDIVDGKREAKPEHANLICTRIKRINKHWLLTGQGDPYGRKVSYQPPKAAPPAPPSPGKRTDRQERIALVVAESYGGSVAAFSDANKVMGPGLVSAILDGEDEPNDELLLTVAENNGVSLDWLLTGTGAMMATPPEESSECLEDADAGPAVVAAPPSLPTPPAPAPAPVRVEAPASPLDFLGALAQQLRDMTEAIADVRAAAARAEARAEAAERQAAEAAELYAKTARSINSVRQLAEDNYDAASERVDELRASVGDLTARFDKLDDRVDELAADLTNAAAADLASLREALTAAVARIAILELRPQAPPAPPTRPSDVESSLSPTALLAPAAWAEHTGPHQKFMVGRGSRRTMAKRILKAYREHGLPVPTHDPDEPDLTPLPVADMRRYARWLAAQVGRSHAIELWFEFWKADGGSHAHSRPALRNGTH